MVCGMLDDAKLIHLTPREQALEDGLLIPYQFPLNGEMVDCCFSKSLWEAYRYAQPTLLAICRKAMNALDWYDEEEDTAPKRRVITASPVPPGARADEVWVISDDEGLLFCHPNEY